MDQRGEIPLLIFKTKKGVVGMANLYTEIRKKHQKEVNDFKMFYAFTDQQFDEGMKKLGLDPSDTDKVISTGYGGFMRKEDAPDFKEMFNRHGKEIEQAVADSDQFIFDMFNYELSNHEYLYTRDPSDAIRSLGLTMKDLEEDPRLMEGLQKAKKYQQDGEQL